MQSWRLSTNIYRKRLQDTAIGGRRIGTRIRSIDRRHLHDLERSPNPHFKVTPQSSLNNVNNCICTLLYLGLQRITNETNQERTAYSSV